MALLKLEVSIAKNRVSFLREGKGVRIRSAVQIPPRSQAVVAATVPQSVQPDEMILVVPMNIGHSLIVANSVNQVGDDGRIDCHVANLEPSILEIAVGTQIASISEEEQVEEPSSVSAAALQLKDTNEMVQVGNQLTRAQLDELFDTLGRHFQRERPDR